jgi:hypothetical protein
MGKKLIITTGQFDKIKSITESTAHGTMVKNINEISEILLF